MIVIELVTVFDKPPHGRDVFIPLSGYHPFMWKLVL